MRLVSRPEEVGGFVLSNKEPVMRALYVVVDSFRPFSRPVTPVTSLRICSRDPQSFDQLLPTIIHHPSPIILTPKSLDTEFRRLAIRLASPLPDPSLTPLSPPPAVNTGAKYPSGLFQPSLRALIGVVRLPLLLLRTAVVLSDGLMAGSSRRAVMASQREVSESLATQPPTLS